MSFETATRKQYRYPSCKGMITTEDLWQLPLTSKSGFDLDSVAKAINADLKARAEESFVTTSADPRKGVLQDMLAIVVHVIGVKQAENETARSLATRKAERDRLNEVLHVRTQAELLTKTPAEIQAMIDALGVESST